MAVRALDDVLAEDMVLVGNGVTYTLEKPVGEGSFGVVWKARTAEGKVVALKFPRTRRVALPANEYEKLRDLQHSNVVRVHDFFQWTDRGVLVLDFVEGRDLGEHIERRDYTSADLGRWSFQLLDALAHLHGANIALGDIKPDNIRVSADDRRLVLIDFGSAASVQSWDNRDRCPGFAPPFDVQFHDYDLVVTGLLIWLLASGKMPGPEVMKDPDRWPLARIPVLRGEATSERVPGWLNRLVRRLTEPDAKRRFRSAAEARAFVAGLVGVVGGVGATSDPHGEDASSPPTPSGYRPSSYGYGSAPVAPTLPRRRPDVRVEIESGEYGVPPDHERYASAGVYILVVIAVAAVAGAAWYASWVYSFGGPPPTTWAP